MDGPLKPLCVACLLLVAGCTGIPGGFFDDSERLSFTADPIIFNEDAVFESRLSVSSDREVSIDRTLEIEGQSKQVTLNA